MGGQARLHAISCMPCPCPARRPDSLCDTIQYQPHTPTTLPFADPAHGWCNSGYIFPASFRARTHFRSSVNLDAVCVHTCEIVAEGGAYFPRPTFRCVGWPSLGCLMGVLMS